LVADDHPLNVTDALRDPESRRQTLEIIRELAESTLLDGRSLLDFLQQNPGRGALYDEISAAVNELADGTTRKDAFVRQSQRDDPVRAVGASPTPEEMREVRDYARRLRAAESVVKAELRQLVEGLNAKLSIRTKGAAGIVDKVQRMVSGADGRPGRPNYRVGDVIDAIGARITVDSTADLGRLMERVRTHFGYGNEGRILEVQNMYARPKTHNPAYRVVPMIVRIEDGGQIYTFELQLNTRRASIAADLDHNVTYKPYIAASAAEQAKVVRIVAGSGGAWSS